MKIKEFYDSISKFDEKYGQTWEGDLEKYLRGILQSIETHLNEKPSLKLFLEIIEEAFKDKTVEFKKEWMEYKNPPEEEKVMDEFQYVKEVILFQIADLRRIKEEEVDNEFKYLGISSPTGNTWYNHHPFSYLECGAAWLVDSKALCDEDEADWYLFGRLLEMGRLYE